MKILVLGGTRFVGRHIVEAALAGGHRVTLFNRGQTNPGLFPDVETLKGDRDGGLDMLRGRRWDAVVDTYGMLPRLVRASTEILKSAAEQYVFISTLAVYADYANPVTGEELPLRELSDPTVEELTGDTYGGLKVLCERAVQEVFGPGALIIRPGFIVGPWDATDRFTYWMRRIQRGGEMLAPGQPDDPMQVIDARDLAHFVVRLVEHRVVDTFNVATVAPTAEAAFVVAVGAPPPVVKVMSAP